MKKIIVLVVSGMLLISGVSLAFADSKSDTNYDYEVYEEQSFEEMMKECELTDEVSKEDFEKLEKLYNEAVQLEKEEKFEQSDAKWEEFDRILMKYFEYPSFEEMMKECELTDEVSKEDFQKLEKLYNEAVQLEKEEKFELADEKWEEFDTILMKYFEYPSFDEIVNELELEDEINEEDLRELEKLYNEAVQLENEEKYEEAEAEWEKFDEILEEYFEYVDFEEDDYFEYQSFEEMIKEELGDSINEADLQKILKLHDEAVQLENEEKYEEADVKWQEFDKILDKYFNEDLN